MSMFKNNIKKDKDSHLRGADAIRAKRKTVIEKQTHQRSESTDDRAAAIFTDLIHHKKRDVKDGNLTRRLVAGVDDEGNTKAVDPDDMEAFMESFYDPEKSSVVMNNADPFKRFTDKDRAKIKALVFQYFSDKKVQRIEMCNAGVTNELVFELVDFMKGNTHVTTLMLDSNDIQIKGLLRIAEMLPENTTLRELTLNNLYQSPINDACEALLDGLEKNESLIKLSLEWRLLQYKDRAQRYIDRNFKRYCDARRAKRKSAKLAKMKTEEEGKTDDPTEEAPKDLPSGEGNVI